MKKSHCDHKHHSHAIAGETSLAECHIHHYGDITSKEDYDPCHIHCVEGKTTYNDGHVHHFKFKTGPAIPQPNGGHNHYYEAETKCEDDHVHCMKGFTTTD